MKTTLIENGTIVTLNNGADTFAPGYLVVQDDIITGIGSGPAPGGIKQQADEYIDASNMAVIPGMVNAHTHLFQTLLRGLGDDKPLLEWLKTAIWPVAQELNGEESYLAGQLGFIENIRSGATSVTDHQYIHREPANDDGVFQAAEECGIRFLLAYGWADMNYHSSLQLTKEYVLAEAERLYKEWHGKDGGRLRFQFGPLIPWGCTNEAMKATFEAARSWGVGTHIHVAETREEVEMNLKDRGKRHIEWMAELGILGPDVQLVHSVWLDDGEISLIRESGSVVVHCPVSNMYLASGAARIKDMKNAGISVALASDGPGSNNSQDMMEVLKTAAVLAKLSTLDAMSVLPGDVLRFACRGGARAFGQPELIGSLEAGKKADIVLVDLNNPFAQPVHNVDSALVYNARASAVDTVIINGRTVMRNKEITVLDEEKLLAEVRQKTKRLFSRAGVTA